MSLKQDRILAFSGSLRKESTPGHLNSGGLFSHSCEGSKETEAPVWSVLSLQTVSHLLAQVHKTIPGMDRQRTDRQTDIVF